RDLHTLPHIDREPVTVLKGRPLAVVQPCLVVDPENARPLAEPTDVLVRNDPTGIPGDSQDALKRLGVGAAAERGEEVTGGQPGEIGMAPAAIPEAGDTAHPPAL